MSLESVLHMVVCLLSLSYIIAQTPMISLLVESYEAQKVFSDSNSLPEGTK